MLILHHCRKGASEDVLEEVSGTMGLTGVADGILVLNRSRNDNDAKVFVTGRDVSEQELVRADPRVDEMNQEADGFCDNEDNYGRGPPRQAWWVYLTDTWTDHDMGGRTIHECNLKTVLEHLKRDVRPATPEELAER